MLFLGVVRCGAEPLAWDYMVLDEGHAIKNPGIYRIEYALALGTHTEHAALALRDTSTVSSLRHLISYCRATV